MYCSHREGDKWKVRFVEMGQVKREVCVASDLYLTENVKIVPAETVGLPGIGLVFLSAAYEANPIRSRAHYTALDYKAADIDPELATPKQVLLKGGKYPKAYWRGRARAHSEIEKLIDQANNFGC